MGLPEASMWAVHSVVFEEIRLAKKSHDRALVVSGFAQKIRYVIQMVGWDFLLTVHNKLCHRTHRFREILSMKVLLPFFLNLAAKYRSRPEMMSPPTPQIQLPINCPVTLFACLHRFRIYQHMIIFGRDCPTGAVPSEKLPL
jgi:hypothetical protein